MLAGYVIESYRAQHMVVRIDRVVTRGGDKGQTSLGDGSRVSKTERRIEAMGAVDELNAHIGVLACHLADVLGEDRQETDGGSDLQRLQSCLFDLGADLCMPPRADVSRPCALPEAAVLWLDERTALMGAHLPDLRSFVLPGGERLAAYAHLVRTVARRAERRVAALGEAAPPFALPFLNRLSDYFFQYARYLNDQGRKDILWQPGYWHENKR